MKILILFIATLNFFSTAYASQLSCEDVVKFDAIQKFGSLDNGLSLKDQLVTVAQSADAILFEGTLVSNDVNAAVEPQETTVYITAAKVNNSCTDVKFLFPSVAE